MAVTADQIAEVRRMVNEPTVTDYSDVAITALIEKYPKMDERGTEPYYWQETSTTPTKVYNTNWIETYSLNAAAADIWTEKAAKLALHINFSADGGSYSRSQEYQQAMNMARFYRARGGGIRTIEMVKSPVENSQDWIGNLPEPRD